MTVSGSPVARVLRGLPFFLVFLAAAATGAGGAGCARAEGEEGSEPVAPDAGAHASVAEASRTAFAAAASPARDPKAIEERAALADAGRLCGERDLPDCPLQLWMKQNATTTIKFGETTALAELFDQIARFTPAPRVVAPDTYPYPNWGSIARDGALASRVGDVAAAKAACRGCHTQYRARYHAELRALPLPIFPPHP